MNCLENIIALRGHCNDTEEALCYINDCIPLKFFSMLATSEDCNGVNLFKRLRRLACDEVISDFKDALGDGYQWQEVIESDIKGGWDSKKSEKLIGEDDKVVIEKHCSDPFLSPEVSSICINSIEDKEVTLCINSGCGVEEKTIKIVCGKNIIPICKTNDSITIWIKEDLWVYDASLSGSCGCGKSCSCDCNSCYQVEYGKCLPFQVCVNCVCLDETLICKYAKQFKDALKWRLAALYWEEFDTSCRKNEVARDKEMAKSRYSKIMGGHDKDGDVTGQKYSKYWPKLWALAKRVKGSLKHTRCVQCRGRRVVQHC